MATEANETPYYGGDYRTWKTVKGQPQRKQYAPNSVRAHIFPEDNLNYIAEPKKPFNFYWRNTKAKFDDEIDTLMERGYVRVIAQAGPGEAERPSANFTNPTRWRRGAEGTVIWQGHELWAQPAEIGEALEEEELRRLDPRRQMKAAEDEIRSIEENEVKRKGLDGIDIVGMSAKPSKPKK